MFRQIEWKVQSGPITKTAVLPVSSLFFWKFFFSIRTCYIKSWFEVQTTQMSIFILSESSGVLFKGTFSLWVYLKLILLQPLETTSIWMCQALWEHFRWSCTYTKTASNKSQLFKETIWVVKLLRCWSACKCSDM